MPLNNENNNKCCKCTTPEYQIILNQQGPQGRQGNPGVDGFSPDISIAENTENSFKLRIEDKDGVITTPNLKATIPTGGQEGTVLTKNSSADGDASWQILPNASPENSGIVELATIDDLTPDDSGEINDLKAVTPDLLSTYVEQEINNAKFVTTNTEQAITSKKTFMTDVAVRGDIILQQSIVNYATVDGIKPNIIEHTSGDNNIIIGETKLFTSETYKNLGIEIKCDNLDNAAGIYTHRDGNKYLLLDSSNITAGENITIDKTSTGITISSTGGGATDAYTKAETDGLLDAKQDKLVATTGIEINNNNIGINQKGTSLIEYNNTDRAIGYIEDDVLHQEQNVTDYIEGIAAPIIDIPDNSIHSFDISTVVKLSDYNDIEDNRIIEIGGTGTNSAFFDTHAYNIKNMVRMVYSVNGISNAYWHETIQDDKYLAVRMTNDGTTLKFFTKIVDTPELPTDWNEWENIPWDLSLYPIEKGNLPAIINIGGEVNKNPANNTISTINIQKGLFYLTQTKIIINNTLFSYTSSNYNDAIATTENYGLVKIDGDSLTINENYQLQANIPSNLTTQGNTFNGASQLVQLDSTGKLPAIDGSQLTNLPGGGSADITDLYQLQYGTESGSIPVTFSGNNITLKSGVLITTPNGTFSYTSDITYQYTFDTERTIFAYKDGSDESYYNMLAVYYGGSQPATNPQGQIAWFDNNVWKMISATGEITTFSTQLITPIAKVYLNGNNVKSIDYASYYKIDISNPTPSNMVTTDTTQTITAIKSFNSPAIFNYNNKPSIAIGNTGSSISMSYEGNISDDSAHILRDTSSDWRVGRYNKQGIISSSTPLQRMGAGPYFNRYPILDTSNLGSYVDGTTITYTDGKLKASGSSAPTNMVTTDTAQTITGMKTFDQNIVFSNNVSLTSQASTFTISLGDVLSPAQYCNITIRDGGLKLIDNDNIGNNLSFITRGTYWRVGGELRRYINGTDYPYITTNDIGNLKYWTGAEADYTAIETKDADTLYRTTDTNKVFLGTIQIGGQ